MTPEWHRILKRHQRNGTLVEFCRRPKIQEQIAGFVIDFSPTLLLLHRLDWSTFSLDGYVIIRNGDINNFRAFSRESHWQNKAVRQLKLRPKAPPKINLEEWSQAIPAAAQHFLLLTFRREYKYPDECLIGAPLTVTTKSIIYDNLDASADWTGPYTLKTKDISRVDFDAGYERALTITASQKKRKNWP